MKRSTRAILVACAVALPASAPAACSLTHDLSDIHGTTQDAAVESAADVAADALPDVVDSGAPGCSQDSGCGGPASACPPCSVGASCARDEQCATHHCVQGYCDCDQQASVQVTKRNQGGTFCIDATEATAAQYAQALAACDGGCVATDVGCTAPMAAPLADGGGGCTADLFDPDGGGALPVVCVTWCDAFAYCEARHSRLCGEFPPNGGGATQHDVDRANPDHDEWFSACSFQGSLVYPYGAAFDAGACNGATLDAGGALPAGSLGSCQGGFPGVFDMSGNVREWQNSCNWQQGTCTVRGGSFESDSQGLRCDDYSVDVPLDQRVPDVGFRCCGG